MDSTLDITQQTVAGVVVLRLKGRILVGESSRILHDAIRDALGQGARKILLQLAEVSYIDSVGVGELVSSYAAAKRVDGELKLSNVSGRVRDLVRLTRLHTIVEVCPDEAAALRSFENAVGASR
jgi:anti-sigma B factor antagonist